MCTYSFVEKSSAIINRYWIIYVAVYFWTNLLLSNCICYSNWNVYPRVHNFGQRQKCRLRSFDSGVQFIVVPTACSTNVCQLVLFMGGTQLPTIHVPVWKAFLWAYAWCWWWHNRAMPIQNIQTLFSLFSIESSHWALTIVMVQKALNNQCTLKSLL